jgi:hypothetical protein
MQRMQSCCATLGHLTQGQEMTRTKLGLACLAAVSLTWLLSGCTVYGSQKTPTLAMTTSAEQVDRIFWADVAAGKWTEVNTLLAPNTVWRVGGRVIPRAEIVPWLQGLKIHAVQVSDVTLTPAVNDMNIVATVQVQAEHAVIAQASGASCAGQQQPQPQTQPQTLSALAVWQQPEPTGTAAKDKSYRGYLLTVHDLSASGDASCH